VVYANSIYTNYWCRPHYCVVTDVNGAISVNMRFGNKHMHGFAYN